MKRLLVALAVAVGFAAIGMRGGLPAPREVLAALGDADYGWLLLAASLQSVSVGAFAFQQRRLLHSLGAHLRRGHAFAIVLAGTAISISMPAGPAVATAFTISKYQRAGATREVAAACVVVSGLASIGGLALLYAGGGIAIVVGSATTLQNWQPLAVVAGLAALTTATVMIGRRYARRLSLRRFGAGSGVRQRLWIGLDSALDAWKAGTELKVRDWATALAYAVVKWLADLTCLIAVARALDLPIGTMTLTSIYLSVQIVRQVPLTPGGVGVVEFALLGALTTAGVGGITAAAAVLLYRLLSCWLIIPVGGIAALTLRHGPDIRP
ncbi:lysylphosphatidylglycerol synthase transmembrane domain-containing protein [Micromonospora lupini]|uniref:lysylphosphatidylglycerol synthase transmembrane domain-containing protein n=1 Tax=Micromonospora lupini TaxID=285679 RepID=UPI001ED9A368|nr:YbhN family protein [Micromonospora lupini]